MPVLEVDGIQLSQSRTIARYLANKYNLTGSTALEQAQADMVVDCGMDFCEGTIVKYIYIERMTLISPKY